MDEDERNHCCLVLLLSRVGVERLRQYFITQWNSVGTFVPWTDCARNGTDLLTKFKPLPYEKDKVKSGDTTRWDLSIFVKALLNSKPPFVVKKSSVSHLDFLRETRNKLCHSPNGKIATPEFNKLWCAACNALQLVGATSKDFRKVKQDVKQPWNEFMLLIKQCASQDDNILRGLNAINARLDQLKHGQEDIKKIIQEGKEELKKNLQEGKEELKKNLQYGKDELKKNLQDGREEVKHCHSDLQKGHEEILQKLHNLNVPTGLSQSHPKLSDEEIKQLSNYLKASTKRRTEFQPKFMASHLVSTARTDEIFTNLMMQHGRKPLPKGAWKVPEGARRSEMLAQYSKLSTKPIERCQDIFFAQKKDEPESEPKSKPKYDPKPEAALKPEPDPDPKSILITGKPGIGKSLFCQKMVRDWTSGVLFQEEPSSERRDFDFVYLMTFRQLNLIGEAEINLREVLNRCSLLDDHSNIDESLFEYIIDHQEKVLFILDGYDEYGQRESITTDCVVHEDNARFAMPVAALISKLLNKRIFGDAVVIVTSRPTEADELGGINFDAFVEIAGFSPKQVKEFIGKYFRSNSQMKNDVLEHIMKNEDLMSLAHIPMLCFLICWCMEWHIEVKPNKRFPVTITELYSEVVEIFEIKHNAQSEYRSAQIPQRFQVPPVVRETFEKLSRLAVQMMKKKKFNFEEHDLEKYGLLSDEIENLKVSGLLTCGPGLRITATKITRHYCFSHLTLHEYFTARWYADSKELPSIKEIESKMVFQFLSGLLSVEKCEELMEKLLDSLRPKEKSTYFPMKYLCEYGNKTFGVKMLQMYPHKFTLMYFINISVLVDIDCDALVFFLDVMSLMWKKYKSQKSEAFKIERLEIRRLSCGVTSVKRICEALKDKFCPITNLALWQFDGKDDHFNCFFEALPLTNIKTLQLGNQLTNKSNRLKLRNALLDPICKVRKLQLECSVLELGSLQYFMNEIIVSNPDLCINIDSKQFLPQR